MGISPDFPSEVHSSTWKNLKWTLAYQQSKISDHTRVSSKWILCHQRPDSNKLNRVSLQIKTTEFLNIIINKEQHYSNSTKPDSQIR